MFYVNQEDGQIISKQRIPSPHSKIKLFLVTYYSERLKVKGYLAEPQWGKQLPGFLYLRGGIKNIGMVRIPRIIQFASEGFIVFAPFYRGNRGGEGREDFAGSDRNDAFNGFKLLTSHPRVNEQDVHLFGFSRGSAMALFTGMEYSSEVRSIVCWGGVSDMFLTYEERVDLRKMLKRVIGTPSKYSDQYRWRTPLEDLDKLFAPVLIIHGAKDQHVTVEHANRLEKGLKEVGKNVESWIYEDFDHFFPPRIDRKVVSKMCEWMKSKI